MRVRRSVPLAAGLLVGLAACAPGDRIYVDAAGSAIFEGRPYLAVAPERVAPPRAVLREVGAVTSTNLDIVDRRAYSIAGVAPERALALTLADGRPIVLIPADDAGSGMALGAFLPELCVFDTDPVADGCPARGS